jgi:hypothetical protein
LLGLDQEEGHAELNVFVVGLEGEGGLVSAHRFVRASRLLEGVRDLLGREGSRVEPRDLAEVVAASGQRFRPAPPGLAGSTPRGCWIRFDRPRPRACSRA